MYLDEIWDLIESVSEEFLTYSFILTWKLNVKVSASSSPGINDAIPFTDT